MNYWTFEVVYDEDGDIPAYGLVERCYSREEAEEIYEALKENPSVFNIELKDLEQLYY